MNQESASTIGTEISSDLGTFEGFNFRSQSAIPRILSASEVVNWNHDTEGEAEFWPSGDRAEMNVLFRDRTSVTGSELMDLDRVLDDLGGDSPENFLRIHYAVNIRGGRLESLTRDEVEDGFLEVRFGSNFSDLRRETAYELFELYYPEEFRVWEKSTCDGLNFDTDRFLDSPAFSVEEIRLGDQVALLIASD